MCYVAQQNIIIEIKIFIKKYYDCIIIKFIWNLIFQIGFWNILIIFIRTSLVWKTRHLLGINFVEINIHNAWNSTFFTYVNILKKVFKKSHYLNINRLSCPLTPLYYWVFIFFLYSFYVSTSQYRNDTFQ